MSPPIIDVIPNAYTQQCTSDAEGAVANGFFNTVLAERLSVRDPPPKLPKR